MIVGSSSNNLKWSISTQKKIKQFINSSLELRKHQNLFVFY